MRTMQNKDTESLQYKCLPFASFNGLTTDVVKEGFVLVVIYHIIIFMVVSHLSFSARVVFLLIT